MAGTTKGTKATKPDGRKTSERRDAFVSFVSFVVECTYD
jgi:hypothetical protein